MSYILDALKRAESDRGLGGVPGLHAQTLAVEPATRHSPRSWLAAGLLAAALLGAMLLWLVLRPQSTGSLATPTQPPAAKTASTSAAEKPFAAPVMEAPTAQPVAPPTPVGAPAYNPNIDSAKARRQPPEARVLAGPPGSPKGPAMTAAQDRPARHSLPDAPPAAASKTPEVVDGLSAQAQATLPKLQISGGTYSESAAYRMVIINGQVLKEGETAAPDARLEKINPRSVVIDFRGKRYSLPY